jgi:hypothetical protein
MQQGERTAEYGAKTAGNCKKQMRLQHLLQLLQSRLLHFGDADADPAAAGDGLITHPSAAVLGEQSKISLTRDASWVRCSSQDYSRSEALVGGFVVQQSARAGTCAAACRPAARQCMQPWMDMESWTILSVRATPRHATVYWSMSKDVDGVTELHTAAQAVHSAHRCSP